MSGVIEKSYNEGLFVDVIQVKRQDVVLAAHVHAIMVLVHTKDSIVRRVEQEGKVMGGSSRLQLYKKKNIYKKNYLISLIYLAEAFIESDTQIRKNNFFNLEFFIKTFYMVMEMLKCHLCLSQH